MSDQQDSLGNDLGLLNYFMRPDGLDGVIMMSNFDEFQNSQSAIEFSDLHYNNPIESNYDQNLTSAHQYMGEGLRETNGRTIFEEGITHQIPVIYLTSNLIPKQIFPLIATCDSLKKLIKYSLARNCVFGVSYKIFGTKNTRTYGTIAEIYAHSGDIETSDKIYIKAMGHQRYEILKTEPFPESNAPNIALAKIRIMPDITLPNPYHKLCLNPRNRHSNHGNNLCRTKDMWQTQWPNWVYKQFDVHQLASRVAEKVKTLYDKIKLTEDPYLLSLQVTKLGMFNPEQVHHLLSLESTNHRLKQALFYLDENQKARVSKKKFICNSEDCYACICDMGNVFPMSPDGPQGTYCNSWGQIHDMITVYRLEPGLGVVKVGQPSDECSWFPGYNN
ncbi:Hypothetical protein CINCED_3A015566 [Cinara cedri]|uniref:CULT domain-containing protein n=1 Tax=Cinara cedri TaxID=506608 RepID=A0A5E4NHY7_9HEMI|nr:Hypothetical protein CINCED_3A015566 [Cinara cedri]